ncbi:hypothetical protein D3C87_2078450 [compost metagenome]
MPSERALRVIISAKASSEPAMFSATTTETSLAESVIMLLMASSTAMIEPGRRPSLVGGCEAA